ncbi:MAG: hypothetical protein QG575_42 [Euryarchaeota archaeon]|nr:hypothetical protein [Euryarchaeota archaeon]
MRLAFVVLTIVLVFLQLEIYSTEAASDGLTTIIQAEEVLNKIRAHEAIDYDYVVINGDLNISNIDLPILLISRVGQENEVPFLSKNIKIIESHINIRNSEIKGTLNLDNILFLDDVDFNGTIFDNNVHFRGSIFNKNACFSHVQFCGKAFFEWSKYFCETNFAGAKFLNESHFLEAEFNKTAIFDHSFFQRFSDFRGIVSRDFASFLETEFLGDTYFQNAKFFKESDFRNSKFYGFSDFSGSKFYQKTDHRANIYMRDARFPYAQFDGEALFSQAYFGNYADFREAQFNENAFFCNNNFSNSAYFMNSKFYKIADFIGSIFNGDADFNDAKFSDSRSYPSLFSRVLFRGNVSFAGSQMSSISDFRYSEFNNNLNLTNMGFDHLEIKWDNIKNNMICDENVYVSLIKNFKNLGQFDDADNCYYHYRIWAQDRKNFISTSKIIDIISWISCGYGIRWQNTIISSFLMMVIFGFFFLSTFYNSRIEGDKLLELIEKSMIISTMTLLSLPSDWYPFEKEEYVSCIKQNIWPAIVERIIGWFLLLLLIGVLTRVMVRY